MKEFSEVAKGNISEEDLSRARQCHNDEVLGVFNNDDVVCIYTYNRNQLKASYEMSSEIQATLVEDIAMQVQANVFMHLKQLHVGDSRNLYFYIHARVYNYIISVPYFFFQSAFKKYCIRYILVNIQASVKGSYTTLADTLKQVDSITKDDIVKVR